ncbi:MAG: Crp/Fnr family transcriptional regulator, partial [Mariprofundaceae bacterium]|nr:Crp/Fnr family transcriptional regulator [Mariprofundaceae bacterium]
MRVVPEEKTWLYSFPELKKNRENAWRITADKAMRMQVKKGSVLFRDGDACNGYVLVVSGSIRVQKIDPQGHEIVLYRVEEGQSCMLTTTCLLAKQNYPAEGVAETDVDLVLLPLDAFDSALAESPSFRRFVMANIGHRISDLMLLLEDVAFGRKDVRLAAFLLKNAAENGDVLEFTHRQMAVELGTAREVVSRLIKDFERKGLVRLGRNRIAVLKIDLIADIAR